MASIKKVYGKWQARVTWHDDKGKRHSKSKNGFPTKKLAMKWSVDVESQLNQGLHVEKSISLLNYYIDWVKTYKQPKLTEKTLNRYTNVQNVIEDYFAQIDIRRL